MDSKTKGGKEGGGRSSSEGLCVRRDGYRVTRLGQCEAFAQQRYPVEQERCRVARVSRRGTVRAG